MAVEFYMDYLTDKFMDHVKGGTESEGSGNNDTINKDQIAQILHDLKIFAIADANRCKGMSASFDKTLELCRDLSDEDIKASMNNNILRILSWNVDTIIIIVDRMYELKTSFKELLKKLKPDVVLVNEICLQYKYETDDAKIELRRRFSRKLKEEGYVLKCLTRSYKDNKHWVRGSAILVRSGMKGFAHPVLRSGKDNGFEYCSIFYKPFGVRIFCVYIPQDLKHITHQRAAQFFNLLTRGIGGGDFNTRSGAFLRIFTNLEDCMDEVHATHQDSKFYHKPTKIDYFFRVKGKSLETNQKKISQEDTVLEESDESEVEEDEDVAPEEVVVENDDDEEEEKEEEIDDNNGKYDNGEVEKMETKDKEISEYDGSIYLRVHKPFSPDSRFVEAHYPTCIEVSKNPFSGDTIVTNCNEEECDNACGKRKDVFCPIAVERRAKIEMKENEKKAEDGITDRERARRSENELKYGFIMKDDELKHPERLLMQAKSITWSNFGDYLRTENPSLDDKKSNLCFLAKYSLVPNYHDCVECGRITLLTEQSRVDGFAWKCQYCKNQIASIRNDSFFAKFMLKSPSDILAIAAIFIDDPAISHQEMHRIRRTAKKTFGNYAGYFLDIIELAVSERSAYLVGGLEKTVDAEELDNGGFVFIERSSKNYVIAHVDELTPTNFIDAISRFVNTGSKVVLPPKWEKVTIQEEFDKKYTAESVIFDDFILDENATRFQQMKWEYKAAWDKNGLDKDVQYMCLLKRIHGEKAFNVFLYGIFLYHPVNIF